MTALRLKSLSRGTRSVGGIRKVSPASEEERAMTWPSAVFWICQYQPDSTARNCGSASAGTVMEMVSPWNSAAAIRFSSEDSSRLANSASAVSR